MYVGFRADTRGTSANDESTFSVDIFRPDHPKSLARLQRGRSPYRRGLLLGLLSWLVPKSVVAVSGGQSMSDQHDETEDALFMAQMCPAVDLSKGEKFSIYSTESNILWRTIRNYRLAWSVSVVAVAAAIYSSFYRGEWKPIGDGRTVVHSRTGEIRDVSEVRSQPDS
jgi:hypothetical protein